MKDTSRLSRKSMHDTQFSTGEVGMDPFQAPCKTTELLPVCQLEANTAISPCNEDNLIKDFQLISIPVMLLQFLSRYSQ